MAASESYIADHLANGAATAGARHWVFPVNPYRDILVGAEVVADLLTCIASLVAAYLIQLKVSGHLDYPIQHVLAFGAVQGVFAVLLLKAAGAYGSCNSLMRIRETERAIRAAVQAVLLLLMVSSILALHLPRLAIAIHLVIMPVLLILQKQMTHSLTQALHARGYGCERVVVYGTGEAGRRIASSLLHSPKMGLQPVANWSNGPAPSDERLSVLGYRRKAAIPVRVDPLTPSALRSLRCSLLIIAAPYLSEVRLMQIENIANQAGVPVAFVSEGTARTDTTLSFVDVDGLLLASPHERSRSWTYAFSKRLIDLVVSALLLIWLSPLLLVVALLVRLSSPGPSLFVQRRVGHDGEFFDMYKFRTMVSDAPRYAVSPTHSNDPRITPIGRVLRRLSLDELPQLINVFLGSMSLVGPRPEMPFIVAAYNDHQRLRLRAKPGITGLWQLSAGRAFPIHENMAYDFYYLRHRTFFMDIAILIHTLFFAVGGGI